MKNALAVALLVAALIAGYAVAKLTDQRGGCVVPPGGISIDLGDSDHHAVVYIDCPRWGNQTDSDALGPETNKTRVWCHVQGVTRVVHETNCGMEVKVSSRDLTADGLPEILVEEWDPKGSGGIREILAYSWNGNGFASLTNDREDRLSFAAGGGFTVKSNGPGRPAFLITYGIDYDDSGSDQGSVYRADIYEMRDQRFVFARTVKTQGSYTDSRNAVEEMRKLW